MDAPEPPETRAPRASPPESRAEELLRDSSLWPLWAVVIGHAIAFLVPVLLMALRDRRLAALAALAILLSATGFAVERRLRSHGRLGPLLGTLLVTWLLAGAAAWVAHVSGIF